MASDWLRHVRLFLCAQPLNKTQQNLSGNLMSSTIFTFFKEIRKSIGHWLVTNWSLETRPWCPSSLIVSRAPLVLGPELAARRAEHSLLWRMSLYIFEILFLSPFKHVCVIILWPLRFGWLLVLGLCKEDYLQLHLNVCPCDYTAFAVSGKVGIPWTCLTTQVELAFVTSTDRPKSVHNHCVIWSIWWRFMPPAWKVRRGHLVFGSSVRL